MNRYTPRTYLEIVLNVPTWLNKLFTEGWGGIRPPPRLNRVNGRNFGWFCRAGQSAGELERPLRLCGLLCSATGTLHFIILFIMANSIAPLTFVQCLMDLGRNEPSDVPEL